MDTSVHKHGAGRCCRRRATYGSRDLFYQYDCLLYLIAVIFEVLQDLYQTKHPHWLQASY